MTRALATLLIAAGIVLICAWLFRPEQAPLWLAGGAIALGTIINRRPAP